MSRELISTGNELAAKAALDSDVEFFGGYPITPSSEIMHILSTELPARGHACIQMEDEISGICTALGAAMSGKRALTASSGPGISLKSENLGVGYFRSSFSCNQCNERWSINWFTYKSCTR